MAISIVQTANGGSLPLSFGSAVTAGNTVFLVVVAYDTSSATISSSAPTLGGSSVTGAAAFFDPGVTNGLNSPPDSGQVAYLTVWMLPNCTGGSTAVNLTVTNDTAVVGAILYEVSGLGTSPALDKSSSGSAGHTTAIDSGSSGAIGFAPEFILGAAGTFSGSGAGPSSPWTNLSPASNAWAGYQIATSSGGSYDWSQTGSAAATWAAAVVTVKGTSGGVSVALTTPDLALAAPLVTVLPADVISLTAPGLALAAPLMTPQSNAEAIQLTTPNLALAAPPLGFPPAGSAGTTPDERNRMFAKLHALGIL